MKPAVAKALKITGITLGSIVGVVLIAVSIIIGIIIELQDSPEIHNAVLHFNDYIASQVLATELKLATFDLEQSGLSTIEMDNYSLIINIKKA